MYKMKPNIILNIFIQIFTFVNNSKLTICFVVALSLKLYALFIRIVCNNNFLNSMFISVQLLSYKAKLIESSCNNIT